MGGQRPAGTRSQLRLAPPVIAAWTCGAKGRLGFFIALSGYDIRHEKSLGLTLLALLSAGTAFSAPADDFADVRREIEKRHDEAVKRLQDWIALPAIAAENLNFPAGAEQMAQLARDAGFQQVAILATDGKPGVFATSDAGAAKTIGLYFMYDVKQYDPAEWTSPPLDVEAGREAGGRHGDGRPRRGQPEGAAVGLAGGAARACARRGTQSCR